MVERAVFDSDMLIDHLQGVPEARTEMAACQERFISVVSWIEVMSGVRDPDADRRCRRFLRRFQLVPVGLEVAELAAELRRVHRLKLPDATIWATARSLGCVLVTRNTADFARSNPEIYIPYAVTPRQ